ncbi:hypothetical protein PAXRUDRAFT_17029 [Paxillus rubicundulus Ve08.2h10]|uniref:Uncharacterized protein n=1 Tax=Paxillus rubicundulus Ve08.2h10 TaxID=930991 RepID=A0A0D0C4V1_9AGAM|nr:hypothetical protein PAXRUDRAFT_17029 [Paxillus rubicundulus Ve08.2h10]
MSKRMVLLEAQKSKGRQGRKAIPAGHLMEAELNQALKEDEICVLSRKFSVTHCLWVSKTIFPLHKNPSTDLNGKERWLSPRSVEDGLKTELLQFVTIENHELMGHSNSSASAFESPADTSEDINYEEAFEHAMEMGLPPPILPGALSPPSCLSSLPPSTAAAPVTAPSNSISAAMQPHLNPDIRNAPAPNSVVPPMPNSEPEPVPELAPAVPEPALEVQVPAVKPKPQSKHKGKAVDMEHTAVGGDEQVGTSSTAGRKTRARSNYAF